MITLISLKKELSHEKNELNSSYLLNIQILKNNFDKGNNFKHNKISFKYSHNEIDFWRILYAAMEIQKKTGRMMGWLF